MRAGYEKETAPSTKQRFNNLTNKNKGKQILQIHLRG